VVGVQRAPGEVGKAPKLNEELIDRQQQADAEGRGGGGASAEEYGGSDRWSEPSSRKERRRVR
jgi:hypothetical protein